MATLLKDMTFGGPVMTGQTKENGGINFTMTSLDALVFNGGDGLVPFVVHEFGQWVFYGVAADSWMANSAIYAGEAHSANSAYWADNATYANWANSAYLANSASYAGQANSAYWANNANYANRADCAVWAVNANRADCAYWAENANRADCAYWAENANFVAWADAAGALRSGGSDIYVEYQGEDWQLMYASDINSIPSDGLILYIVRSQSGQ